MKKVKAFFTLIAFLGFSFFFNACTTTTNDPIINNAVKTPGALGIQFTTSTYKGEYAPDHVLAVWIESNSGTFVKSLLVKASERKQHLTNWLKSTSSGNTTDAVTGATLSSHGLINCNWNGTNTSSAVVGDGSYKLCVEYTESSSGSSKFASFTFDKATAASSSTPSGTAGISGITITWTPK